jgi:hypothetical protein
MYVCTYALRLRRPLKKLLKPGLPDGIFSNKKIPIWGNFGGSCTGRCWHFLAIWSVLRPVVVFCGHLVHIYFPAFVYFFLFLYGVPRKIWQP